MIEVLVVSEDKETVFKSLSNSGLLKEYISSEENTWTVFTLSGIKVCVYFAPEEEFAWRLLCSTGSKAHLEQLQQVNNLENYRKAQSEQEIYQALGLDYIEHELREGLEEVRSEEPRVGKECVSKGRYRWWRYN